MTTNQQTYRGDQNLGRFGSVFVRFTKSHYQNSGPYNSADFVHGTEQYFQDEKNWAVSYTINPTAADVHAALLGVQKILGQTLFFPPNVAGWKGGNAWIDSASLMVRLNMARVILNGSSDDFRAKPEFEDAAQYGSYKKRQIIIKSDWSALVNWFGGAEDEALLKEITDYLIQCNTKQIDFNTIAGADNSSREKYVSGLITNVMSLPEFQLI